MVAYERHRRILELLQHQPAVRSADLARQLSVTPMTIWRDLRILADQGLLRRTHGGATRLKTPGEPTFAEKADRLQPVKERLAEFAAALIAPGEILILDGGTTTAALARAALPAGLTVLTNSLPVARFLADNSARPTVYLSGGLLRPESGTLVGREAVTFFARRRAHRYFMSATALDADAGITDPNPQEIEVKQVMVQRSTEVILLADQSKFHQVSLLQTLPWNWLSRLITDSPHPPLPPGLTVPPAPALPGTPDGVFSFLLK